MARAVLPEGCEEVLRAALAALGAQAVEQSWGVGGAVEETAYDVTLAGCSARLWLRSFEGPLLKGDRAVVEAIAAEVARRLAAAG